MSSIKRISVRKLEVGMYITDQTEGIADGKMLQKGFIRRAETLKKIQEKEINDVFIDVSKGEDSAFATPILSKETTFRPRVSLVEEREKADKVYGEARGLVENVLNNVKMGRAIDVTPVAELAEDINNSILNNANALLCLSQIRDKDKYLLEHSVNVGILMSIFSTYLGFDKVTVKELTTGALLHDIGKIRVPTEILNKPGSLTDEEWIEMKRHVAYGQAVLAKSEGISDIAKSICALHHERLDGSGYPTGIIGDEIDIYGRLGAIVDVYDAVTASRCYHEGMSPFKAMKLLLSLAGNHFDKNLAYSFIRCMSVYPVGTVVELDNGRLGVVIETNADLPNKPRLRIFYNMKHKHYEQPSVIDLASSMVDKEIVKTWHPDDVGINIDEFL